MNGSSEVVIEDSSGPATGQVPLPWILAVLLRERRLILKVAGVGFVLAFGLALMKGKSYTATFSFIPQSGESQGAGGLASLAGQFGLAIGALGSSSQPPQLYADLLATRGVLMAIAKDSFPDVDIGGKRVPLAEFLKIKGEEAPVVLENTLRTLRTSIVSTTVATRTTGMVAVKVTTRSPEVSLQIARRLLESLNRFNVETRKSQAAEERRFTEGRLEAAKTSLRSSEDALQSFLQANRQFGNSPELTFRRERLQREVALHQQVVTGLSQQYEDARIREVRDTPVITVIEQPALPVLPNPRGRLILLVVMTFSTLLMGIAFVLAREGWRRKRRQDAHDPSYAMLSNEWQRFRGSSKET